MLIVILALALSKVPLLALYVNVSLPEKSKFGVYDQIPASSKTTPLIGLSTIEYVNGKPFGSDAKKLNETGLFCVPSAEVSDAVGLPGVSSTSIFILTGSQVNSPFDTT